MAIFNDYLISSKEIKYLLNTETQKILSTNVYSYAIENLGTITKSHKREIPIKYGSELSQMPVKKKSIWWIAKDYQWHLKRVPGYLKSTTDVIKSTVNEGGFLCGGEKSKYLQLIKFKRK